MLETGDRRVPQLPAAGARAPLRVVPTRANTQPAFGCYTPEAEAGTAQPAGLFVLTLEGDAVSAMTWFADPALFEHVGLPRTLRS
jgi:hypothetical protein